MWFFLFNMHRANKKWMHCLPNLFKIKWKHLWRCTLTKIWYEKWKYCLSVPVFFDDMVISNLYYFLIIMFSFLLNIIIFIIGFNIYFKHWLLSKKISAINVLKHCHWRPRYSSLTYFFSIHLNKKQLSNYYG